MRCNMSLTLKLLNMCYFTNAEYMTYITVAEYVTYIRVAE